jgi:hypothetical protein
VNTFIFVADIFVEQYRGGAELTTHAIMSNNGNIANIIKINCKNLTVQILEKYKDCYFVVCNFATLDDNVKLYMCKNIKYSIIEYDYKFCQYRSMEKHKTITGDNCDCVESTKGKINSAFYGYAQRLWFMSEGQKNIFLSKLKTIKKENCEVLSSVFSDGDLDFMESIKDNEKNDKYLILSSDSWIKGTKQCIQYAKDNNLEYELVKNLPYHELLIKMSTSRGLIFLPLGFDTCPRIVIEAKLLGCDVITNENVQHRDEEWFSSEEQCRAYMKTRASRFWGFYFWKYYDSNEKKYEE